MWFVLKSTLVIVILSLSSCPGVLNPVKSIPIALIHYPSLAFDYAVRTEAHSGCTCLDTFKNLSKAKRKEACLNYLVDAVSFSVAPDKTDYIDDDFGSLVDETFSAPENPYSSELPIKTVANELRAPAHVCVRSDEYGQSWAISPGHRDGTFMLLKKPDDLLDYELFGLLEKMPNFNAKLNQRQLDTLYTTGTTDTPDPNLTNNPEMKASSSSSRPNKADNTNEDEKSVLRPAPRPLEKRESTLNLCKLTAFEQFRICAVGFLAWKHSQAEFPEYNEGNYVAQGSGSEWRCIKGKIGLDFRAPSEDAEDSPIKNKLEHKQYYIEADILPCSINMKSNFAKFFLTGDPFSTDSMFSVEAYWEKETASVHSIEDKINMFELELHMTNVLALSRLDGLNYH